MKKYLCFIPVLLLASCYLELDLQYEDEFADSFYTAFQLPVNSWYSDSFSRDEDQDYYRFYAYEGDNISISTTGTPQMSVSVYNEYRYHMAHESSTYYENGTSLEIEIPADGYYYIQLNSWGYDRTGSYDLHIYSTYY